MKKGYIIFLILVILIIVLLIIYPFVPSEVQLGILITVIAIPVCSVFFFMFFFLEGGGLHTVPDESVDYQRPLVQDRRVFLEHQPFICAKCNAFTDTLREYCENCGAKDSLRKATKKDYDRFIKKK